MRANLFFYLILWHGGLYAQLPEYEVGLGGRQGVSKLPSGVKVLYADRQELCVVKSRPMDAAIDRPWMLSWYDRTSFYKTDSLILDIREEGRKCQVDQLIQINNRIYIIYSLIGPHHREISVFARQLDPAGRSLSNASRRIFKFTAAKQRSFKPGRINIAMSPDQTRISFTRGVARDSVNNEVAFVAVLDSSLNEQWKQIITLPYPAGLMKIQNLKLSNEGDVFALIMLKNYNQLNASFDVIITRNGGASARRYSVQAKDGFVSSAQIELDNDRLVCAGFYSRTGGQAASGIFFNTIDTKSLKHSESSSDFDPKLVLQDVHPRDFLALQSKAEHDLSAELDHFIVDHLILKPDGGFILIGEQRYDYSIGADYLRSRNMPTRTNYRTGRNLYQPSRFYRGDIVAIKADPNGVIEWENKIHKAQDTNDHRQIFTSYMVLNIRERVRLLFNEDRRNVTGFELSKEKDFAGATPVIAIVTLSDDGTAIRDLIYDSADWPIVMSPAMSSQISENEVVLYGHKFHREQFSRIRFK